MQQPFLSGHNRDADGNPAGGYAVARGVTVEWQNGPLGRGVARQEPNGAFVETLLAIVVDRLSFYQGTQFACIENERALDGIQTALEALHSRTVAREARAVEGTHTR
jgi:hypothetical protein